MRKEKRKQPHPQTQTIPNNATQKCPKSSFLVDLVTELSELSLGLLVDLGALLGIGKVSSGSLLASVVCGTLNLSSLLKSGNNILVLPADLVGESADSAVLASWLQSQDTESLWDDHALDLVVWWWDTLEDLKSLHGSGTTSSLVRNHTTDGLVEDSRWSTEMEWTTSGWVVSSHLSEVGVVLQLSTEELSRDVKSLTSHNNDLLAVEELLSHGTGQATKEMTLAINSDGVLEGRHFGPASQINGRS